MFVELLDFFAQTYATVFGITAPPLHDPLAVAVILDGIVGLEIPFYDSLEEENAQHRYRVIVIVEGTHDEAVSGKTQTGRTDLEDLHYTIKQ